MITFNEVIAFIKKAIDKKYDINSYSYSDNDSSFCFSNDFYITFFFSRKQIVLICNSYWTKYIVYDFTERDILNIKSLMLSVKEMNEKKLENKFYNFFNEDDNKPVDINDLDDEEDK